MVEQAIYASARTQVRDGYQIVAASPGVLPEDVRELAVWCPSHDGLLDATGRTPSLNAFPLPSGAYCVARSFAADAEYSGRGGMHVVTHALLLSAGDYLRFAKNPFAAMRAAMAAGHVTTTVSCERSLQSFSLAGRARRFDRTRIERQVARHSSGGFAHALQTCLAADTTVVAADDAPDLLAALLECLPVGLRARLSLATGLVFSPTRPYQWIGHAVDPHALRRLENSYGVAVATMSEGTRDLPRAAASCHAWVDFVHDCVANRRYSELESRVHHAADVTNVAELDKLAAEAVWTVRGEAKYDPLAAAAQWAPVSSPTFELTR